MALAGLWLLTGGVRSANFGDAITLVAAATYAAHLLATDRYMDASSLVSLVTRLQEGARDGLPRTASQMKEILGLTRKHLIPFLEYCDRQQITVRNGDLRTVRPRK